MALIIIDYYLNAIESHVRTAEACEMAEAFADRMLKAGQISREQRDRATDAISRMTVLLGKEA